MLHFDLTHLRGLEHFVRGYVAAVIVPAPGDKQQKAEQWQRLTNGLAMAASAPKFRESSARGDDTEDVESSRGSILGPSTTFSGPDHAIDVLLLGLRLSNIAGIAATPQEWTDLVSELHNLSSDVNEDSFGS